MTLCRCVIVFCLALVLVCLAGGYVVAGLPAVAGAVLPPILAWTVAGFAPKRAAPWLSSACLLCLVCLAAVGLLVGAPPLLMILGATAALAGWDLTGLAVTMAGSSPSVTAAQFERRHLLFLCAALGLGLLLAAGGMFLPLRIPFALLLLLVIGDIFSLDRATHLARRNPQP